MAAFGRRCIPPPPQRGCRVGDPGPGCVARRSNIPDILATRALPGGRGPQRGSRAGGPGRLAALDASPYLCDGPLSPGTLYGSIKRLLEDGLIEELADRHDPEDDNV